LLSSANGSAILILAPSFGASITVSATSVSVTVVFFLVSSFVSFAYIASLVFGKFINNCCSSEVGT